MRTRICWRSMTREPGHFNASASSPAGRRTRFRWPCGWPSRSRRFPASTPSARAGRSGLNLFHPLLFHLLDVACVCDALWKHCLSERVRRRLVDSLGLTEEQARIAVILLAGLHDIGKAIPTFSRQQIRLFELTGLPDTTI